MESGAAGKLLERDLLFALEAVLRMNEQDDVRALQEEALSCLRALIPCSQAMFFAATTRADGTRGLRRPVVAGVPARYFDEFVAGGYPEDAYFQGMYLSAQNRAFRDSDIMPEGYRMSTRVYREVFEKQGIHFALRSPVVHAGVVRGSISLFNAREEGDFSERDVMLLDVLVPHVAQRMAALERMQAGAGPASRAEAQAGAGPGPQPQPQAGPGPQPQAGAVSGSAAPGADTVARVEAPSLLTPREREVVVLVERGLSDAEIAERLCISRLTLKKHVSNMYRKLGVGSRTQLLAAVRDSR